MLPSLISFLLPIQTGRSRHLHLRHPPRHTLVCSHRPAWRDVINADPFRLLRVGDLSVPRHLWRRDLRARGVYRSVEYVVERLLFNGHQVPTTHHVPSHLRDDLIVTIRPVNRLHPHFERQWPVSIRLGDAKLWSYKRDVIVCAIVCIVLSMIMLVTPIALSMYCGIYAIVSESMTPTLQRGDAILVEKMSLPSVKPRTGEMVFFHVPSDVKVAMKAAGGTLHGRDLLVKRIVARAGDWVDVGINGVKVNGVEVAGPVEGMARTYLRSGSFRVEEGFVFVLGDNAAVSIDSRFWGLLAEADVVGRPVARIFPLDRFSVGI